MLSVKRSESTTLPTAIKSVAAKLKMQSILVRAVPCATVSAVSVSILSLMDCSASIKATSVSVTDMGDDDVKLAPTSGINLEKVDTSKPCIIDENFVVLVGKCSNTKKTYLVKYAKRMAEYKDMDYGNLGLLKNEFKLVGAYPIDEETYNSLSDGNSNQSINTTALRGVPTCPCCGAQLGVVVCECGNIMCSDGNTTACPWCGMEGSLGEIAAGGADITRGRG